MSLADIARFNSKTSKDDDAPDVITDPNAEVLFSPGVGWRTFNKARLRRLSVGHALSKIATILIG